MSEPSSRNSPAPSSADVPQWINDLVPIAARARALLRATAPALLGAVAAVLLLPQLAPFPTPWVATACIALGGFLALRHGGPAVPAADVSTTGGSVPGPRAAPGASAAAAVGELRPGGRTGALLVVLDLLLSVTGLAAWAGLALAGTEQTLLVAA
ncbi:MAG: hypothetical protein I3J03_07785, partial [Actinomyces succiniciruminis]|nr:hypothetical protein [Actinomyces succiniciruminis]